MNKAYDRINWENYPSDKTPINESNLNKIDSATDTLDNRIISLDNTKATKTEVATLVQDVTFEEKTGIITIVKKNGSKVTIDTQMEKIAINFSYDVNTQKIILTLIDGTKQYIDLAALITQYEFLDTDTIAFSINSSGKVEAIVKEGSIKEKHLQPNYLADIKVEVAKAQASSTSASNSAKEAKTSETNAKASQNAAQTSATNANNYAIKSQSYAVGNTGSRTGENTDNAKYYNQQASNSKTSALNSATSASNSASKAESSATSASNSASKAESSATTATNKATLASNSAQNASTSEANAKKYYEQTKSISATVAGAVTGVKGNAETTYRTGGVNLTPANIGALPSNGNAVSATKLATARNINGIKFDGTSDIQLPLYYSYSFGVTQNVTYYSSFCRMNKTNKESECETTVLVTATGNFGGTVPGTYLISMSNRGQKATMTVVCLQKSSQADLTFGYYSDDTYFYFGVIRPTYSYSTNLTVLSKSASAETGKFLNSTTKPTNWVDVAIANSIGGNASTVNGHTVNADVPANAKFTDTTYSTGNTSTLGLTKLYTGIGTATDGTMTQSAIKSALDNKLSISGGAVTGDIIPNTNELINLGHKDKKWDNVWVHCVEADYINAQDGIRGNLTGNADTATKAVKDNAGDNIITSYRKRMGSVPNNDFNNATVEGVYTYGSSTGIANSYTNGGIWGTLEVFNNGYNSTQGVAGTVIHQIAFTTNNQIYFRQRINSSDWTLWKELTTKFSDGKIKVTNPAYSKGYVCAWVDSEGGNLEIQSSDGATTYQIDASNNDIIRIFSNNSDGSHKFLKFNGKTGVLSADGGFAGNASTVNGHTVNADVPANAKFTDTNTWRGIQNNLTSDSTTDCLSAAQGKALANGSARDNTKLSLTGGTITGTIISSLATNTYLNGNKGVAIINSTASAGIYTMLAKMNSADGYFTQGVYGKKYLLQYTTKSTVDSNSNSVTKSITLLDEDGSSSFAFSNHTHANFVKSGMTAKAGLVPAPSTTPGTTKYLREDGTWQVPPNTNTTYAAGTGIGLSNTTFYNTGVRSIATGSTNGSVAVNTNGTVADVKVKGLNTLAYASGTWNKLTGKNCTLWYNEVAVYLEISAQIVNLTEYGGTASNKTIVVLPTNVIPTKDVFLGTISALNSAWVPLNKAVMCNINYNSRNLTLRPTEALINVVLNLTAMFPRSLFTIT